MCPFFKICRLSVDFYKNEFREKDGILILVVLIALVGIFKTQLIDLVGDIFEKITNKGLAI